MPALARVPAPRVLEDVRRAASVLAFDLQAWTAAMLADELAPNVPGGVPLRHVAWSEIPRLVFVPRATAEAREVAAQLFPQYPNARTQVAMFADVVRGLGFGRVPHLDGEDPRDVVGALFRGALLERGAEIEPSLGEPALVFRYQGARVLPRDLTLRAFENDGARVALEQWAQALAGVSPCLASFSSTIMSAMR